MAKKENVELEYSYRKQLERGGKYDNIDYKPLMDLAPVSRQANTLEEQVMRIMRASGYRQEPYPDEDFDDEYYDEDFDDLQEYLYDIQLSRAEKEEIEATTPKQQVSADVEPPKATEPAGVGKDNLPTENANEGVVS